VTKRLALGTRLVALLALACLGCDDLSAFQTGGKHVFHGEIIGSDAIAGDASFIRQGFASHTQMELTFDPRLATLAMSADAAVGAGPAAGPGTLTTYACPKAAARCAQGQRTAQVFERAELEPITGLAHDALSQYTFPGGGRLRNYIFGARFSTPSVTGSVQRHAMVFVSLMENEDVEVRVIAPSVLSADGTSEPASEPAGALFGVFVLERRSK
jgi:hypothetical protein